MMMLDIVPSTMDDNRIGRVRRRVVELVLEKNKKMMAG
jgi:hypothetical protein